MNNKTYFVSYSHPTGFGHMEVKMKFPVETYSDILEMRKAMMKAFPERGEIIVMFFREIKPEKNEKEDVFK